MTKHIAEMVGSEIRFLTRLQTNYDPKWIV